VRECDDLKKGKPRKGGKGGGECKKGERRGHCDRLLGGALGLHFEILDVQWSEQAVGSNALKILALPWERERAVKKGGEEDRNKQFTKSLDLAIRKRKRTDAPESRFEAGSNEPKKGGPKKARPRKKQNGASPW